MENTAKELAGEPTIGISLQIPVAKDGTVLVLQSFIDRECDEKGLNAILDKIQKAASRQQAKVELPNLRLRLTNLNNTLEQGTAQLANIDDRHREAHANRRGDMKLSVTEKTDRNNVVIGQTRLKQDIEVTEKLIKEAEELIG